MTETTKRHMQLILDLVACYADHPEKIKLTATELIVRSNGVPSSVYWRMQASGEDHGKLTGRGGANVHALEFIVAELGAAADSDYHFQLVNPVTPAPDRRSDTAPEICDDYDCKPIVELIGRLVTEIASREFQITADGAVPGRSVLTRRLTVAFNSDDDFNDFNYFTDETTGLGPGDDPSLLDSINTLLRAMHRKQGALVEVACVMAKKVVGAK